jgi:tRNA(Ile)-lysidine synthetase-like protein
LRYHIPVHSLAQRVHSHIRQQELLRAGDRIGVAVSGGIDSVALLRLLLELRGELGIVLSVVHFNHKLRGAESDADEQFVANLAREHGLEFYADSDDVAQHATEEHVSVEAAARELRYGFFRYLLGEECPSGADARSDFESADRSAERAALPKIPTLSLQKTQGQGWGNPGAPPKDYPQGLKPDSSDSPQRGAEAPLFHVTAGGISHLDKIATGHTLDDQAETVLMRMIRGAGLRGLGGIYPRIAVEDDEGEICGEIIRPLLTFRRRELRQYLFDIRQDWREDSTNADDAFTRNRVRQLVVPLIEKEFNPVFAENLAELAEIARVEEDYWENEVAGWMGTGVHWSEPEWARVLSKPAGLVQIEAVQSGGEPCVRSEEDDDKEGRLAPIATQSTRRGAVAPSDPSRDKGRLARDDNARILLTEKIENVPWLVMNATVDRLWFLGEPLAVQRRIVKAIGDHAGFPLEFKHVEEILHFAADDHASGKELSLPLGWKVARTPNEIVFLTPNLLTPNLLTPDLREAEPLRDYEYDLPVPGQATIYETASTIEARLITADAVTGYNPEELLDAKSLPRPLRVRNWHPGDRFWPAHTKSPKKIKELLQERHVPQAERRRWPVVVSGDEIVWLRGFPPPAKLRGHPGRDAILITEKPLAESAT